jgi:hypothetical protein
MRTGCLEVRTGAVFGYYLPRRQVPAFDVAVRQGGSVLTTVEDGPTTEFIRESGGTHRERGDPGEAEDNGDEKPDTVQRTERQREQ